MKYKEFLNWCNERAHDGCWGYMEAITCLNIINDMKATPFFQREKKWRKHEPIASEIVRLTNEKSKEMEMKDALQA